MSRDRGGEPGGACGKGAGGRASSTARPRERKPSNKLVEAVTAMDSPPPPPPADADAVPPADAVTPAAPPPRLASPESRRPRERKPSLALVESLANLDGGALLPRKKHKPKTGPTGAGPNLHGRSVRVDMGGRFLAGSLITNPNQAVTGHQWVIKYEDGVESDEEISFPEPSITLLGSKPRPAAATPGARGGKGGQGVAKGKRGGAKGGGGRGGGVAKGKGGGGAGAGAGAGTGAGTGAAAKKPPKKERPPPAPIPEPAPEILTDYELERLERIRRNREVMEKFGIHMTAAEMAPAPAPVAAPRPKRPRADFDPSDLRRSRRVGGGDPQYAEVWTPRARERPRDVWIDTSTGCSKCRWSKGGCAKCRGMPRPAPLPRPPPQEADEADEVGEAGDFEAGG